MTSDTKQPSDSPPSSRAPGSNRRIHDRVSVTWDVDCVADETFLFASITNISQVGIFVQALQPLPLGMRVNLAFSPPGQAPFRLVGEVAWVNQLRQGAENPNPGMGIRFINLSAEERERLVEVIHAIAYVRDPE